MSPSWHLKLVSLDVKKNSLRWFSLVPVEHIDNADYVSSGDRWRLIRPERGDNHRIP